MRKKTKRNLVIVGIILAVALTVYFLSISDVGFLSITGDQASTNGLSIQSSNIEDLSFCSVYEECISTLESRGIPDNYLEDNNLEIICSGGICKISK